MKDSDEQHQWPLRDGKGHGGNDAQVRPALATGDNPSHMSDPGWLINRAFGRVPQTGVGFF